MQLFSLNPISDDSVEGYSVVTAEKGYITPWSRYFWNGVGISGELSWYLPNLPVYTYVSRDTFYVPEENTIFISSESFDLQLLIHEVQHALQNRDKRIGGFDTSLGYYAYLSHPGEIEARWASGRDYTTNVDPRITELFLRRYREKLAHITGVDGS